MINNNNGTVDILINKLAKAKNMDNETLAQMRNVLTSTVTELENTAKMLENPSTKLFDKNSIIKAEHLKSSPKIACQGVRGAYSHIAGNTFFKEPDITFYKYFSDVTKAVSNGEVEFGILPVENSSAGSVEEVIELVCKYNCYINSLAQIRVQHCLAAAPGAKIENIKKIYSHPQALMQCAEYIRSNNFETISTTNTAVAAKRIAESKNPDEACLCSELGAEIYGLEILKKGVQDQNENYTRFICISKAAVVLPSADTVSVALSFPNQPGALSNLLTMFSAFNLDLTKIQSMPIGGADFNVRFHLDFNGSIKDKRVENLLGHMYDIYDDFQFLGNFGKI